MMLKDQDKSFFVRDLDKQWCTEKTENENMLNKTHHMNIPTWRWEYSMYEYKKSLDPSITILELGVFSLVKIS